MVHEVEVGKNVRLSYSKIKEVLDMPNLIEVQKDSYKWFLEEGLKEIFHDISPITDHAGKLVLEFFDYRLDYNFSYVWINFYFALEFDPSYMTASSAPL